MVNLSRAFGSPTYISVEKGRGNFPLSTAGRSTSLCVSSQDFPGVSRVAGLLQADVGRVTGSEPELHVDAYPPSTEIILIGTLGKNPVIDQLVRDNRLDVGGVAGKWEASLIQIIDRPLTHVDRALVIAGSDKRGTLYGMLDLSARIGVSPWYWWADIPVHPQGDLFVVPGRHTQGEPAVKYRGIFINDEVPALSKWAGEKFGGFNHRFYEKVFELILRLKGNYLWPAMWGSAFNDDDPANPQLADEYGIVMGTSHHEPKPKANAMPEVEEISIPDSAEMGVAIEGSEDWWPMAEGEPVLPATDCYHQQTTIIEIFNRGKAPFDYHIEPGAPWLSVIPSQGTVEKECRLLVCADWAHVPFGSQLVPITIAGPYGSRVVVKTVVHHPESPARDAVQGFVEGNGYVSMEAEHYSRAVAKPPIKWQRIPNLGRTLSAMTPFPVTAQSQALGVESPRLEYRIVLFGKGLVRVQAYLSPTLDFHNEQGLRYAISFDDEAPQIVYIHADNSDQAWERSVSDNIRVTVSEHHLARAGEHILKFWMVDPGVVLQKLVVATGDIGSSYLGPPESFHRPVDSVEG